MTSNSELPPNAIAVVGMAARLPGANTLSAFWDNLRPRRGVDRHAGRRRPAGRGHPREDAGEPRLCAACRADGRHRRIRRRLLRFHPAGGPLDRSPAPAVPADRVPCDRGRRLRPRPRSRARSVSTRPVPPAATCCTTSCPIVTPMWLWDKVLRSTWSSCPCRTTRTTWPPRWRTRSTCAGPRSRCRPRARRRWSRCTWPARAS